MEGAARLIAAYNKPRISLCCTACCCCDTAEKRAYKRKLFHKKWLKVETAVDPGLINWENLGLSMKARCVRITLLTIVSLILLIVTTIGILFAKVKENEFKNETIVCDFEEALTPEEALIDLQKPEEKQEDLMYCYCRGILWENVA